MRRFTRGTFAALALLCSIALTTCKDSAGTDNSPQPGWLALTLATPHTDDGAVMFTVAGAALDSVRSTHRYVLTSREGASSIKVIVAGDLSAGAVAEIRVPDVRQAAQYRATVQEAASRTTFEQRAVSGYTITVAAPATR